MKFFFIINSTEFHFDAEAVYSKDIPDEVFHRRENYVRVTKEDIRGFMNGMLELRY